MSWLANFASWIDGSTEPHVTDFQNITADIHTWGGNVDAAAYGLTNLGFLSMNPGALPGTTYTVTGASWASSFATFTIGTHAIQVGQLITVSGVTPSGWNVVQAPVTAIGSSTVTVAMTANPGAWSSGGTVQADGASAAEGMLAVDPNGVLWLYNGSAWQTLLGSIPSGAVIGGVASAGIGIPVIVAALDLYAKQANQSGTLYAVPSGKAGFYRVTVHQGLSQGASTSCTTPTNSITYMSNDDTGSITQVATTGSSANSVSNNQDGQVTVYAEAGSNITYSQTGYASVGSTPMQFNLHFRVEYLG